MQTRLRLQLVQAGYPGRTAVPIYLGGRLALPIGLGAASVTILSVLGMTSMAGIPSSHAGVASGFLMTGHEIGAALGVAVLSAVASTAGSLATPDGAADAFSRGFIGAAVIGGAFALFALLRMPKAVPAGAGGHMHMH